ncbi:D-alanine--D-alanine ligase [Dechloromonas sp.]|uniref:D-alanine--D-alanine ligase n=1 Tax=Dechloromonas sp. TaxID=1917218 RepID=UPI0012041998|nr:D-alanine--D-alanine ligase [Dechloromonas sp.]MBU3697742.1 D-alanine--D-alanine ligase [Dechloromonas sp.]TEX49883.1 MAG: D-alanine--D-alanine ligase [Rhodocyclaceae bacterium]
MSEFGKVAVLFGGTSAERAVSLNSGSRVLAALQGQGIDAHAFDPASQPLDELKGYDRAFIALHGRHGEDGTIQGALEVMHTPYTGSGVLASALAMDKFRTKLMWQAAGLAIPSYVLLNADTDFAAVEARLGLPMFVKPAREGSSIGVTKVKNSGELKAAYEEAARHDPLVIAEKAITGGEYTVGIIGGQALPIIKIEPATEWYDYEAKYNRDDTRYLCPCGLPEKQEEMIRQEALAAFRILGGRGWGRVDFLMDNAGNHYFLEVNTAPGMTDHSLVPMAARVAGMAYPALVRRVLELATHD